MENAPKLVCTWQWQELLTEKDIRRSELYWEKAAWEEAEHAAKFADLLGEVVTDSTKKNLEMRVEAKGRCMRRQEGSG